MGSGGLFLHKYDTKAKLYDTEGTKSLTDQYRLTNRKYITDNALLKANNLSGLADAGTARTNLGVAIGSDVQAYDAQLASLAALSVAAVNNLSDISALSHADGAVIVSDGTDWVAESGSTARTSLGLVIGTDVQAYDAQLADIAGLSPTDANFVVGDGSSFVLETGSTARSSLGLGSISTQNSNSVTITGGSVSGITDILVADGGTGASSASGARTNLGVAIGSDVQAFDAQLADVAGLNPADGAVVIGDGSNFVAESGATLRTSVGVGTSDSPQFAGIELGHASDNTLTASSGDLSIEGNVVYRAGGTDVPLTDGGTGASSASAARDNLGLAIGSDVQAWDAQLDSLAAFSAAKVTNIDALGGLTSAANKIPMFSGSGTAGLISFLDEDGLTSNSASAVPSQQSVKAFVEAQVQGLDIKDSVRIASTANVAGSYSSGVLTVSSAGVLTIDGGNIAINNRVLLKNQGGVASHVQNGIYKCTTAGASGINTQPDTSSASTLDDAQYGSSSTLSSIQMTSASLSSSSTFIQYASYTGSSFTPPANGVMILSDGSDTIAFNLSGYPSSLNSSGSWPIASSPNNYNATYSSVTSLSVDSSTTVAFRSQTVASLFSIGNGGAMTSSSSSFALSSGWGGSTISTGHYIEYENASGNNWYWRIESDLENGDTSVIVSFDSDDSYNTSPTGAYFSGSSTLALFEGKTPGAATAAVLTRATDFDTDADISPGAFCFVEEGTIASDTGFVLSTNDPITLDSTALSFTQFSSAGVPSAGDGLETSGNVFSVDLKANGGLVIESSEVAVDLAASSITGTLAIGDGGTGATSDSAARTALGVAIGSDVQAFDAQLSDIAGLTPTDGHVIVGNGSNFIAESGSTARASLGLAIGSDVQAYDAQLASIAGLSDADGKFIVGSSSGFVAEDGATARASLGVSIGSDVQAYDAQLADVAGLSPADGSFIVGDGSSFIAESGATVRTSLGMDMAAGQGVALPSGTSIQTITSSNPASPSTVSNLRAQYVFDMSGAGAARTFDLPTTVGQTPGAQFGIKIKGDMGSSASLVIAAPTASGGGQEQIENASGVGASLTLDGSYQAVKLMLVAAHDDGSGAIHCWSVID